MSRLSTIEAFDRAQKIRKDWTLGLFETKTALARSYGMPLSYVAKILDGKKCKDIKPPKGNYMGIILSGTRFAVYDDGRIWSYTKNFIMKFKPNSYQIFHTVCMKTKVRTKHRVHILVIKQFGPPRPKGCRLVRHLDDTPDNNAIENLAWGTDALNAEDRLRNGRRNMGCTMKATLFKNYDKLRAKYKTDKAFSEDYAEWLSLIRNQYYAPSIIEETLRKRKTIIGVN